MPWDFFCPDCGTVLDCEMTDDHEEMKKEWAERSGTTVHCDSCNKTFDFDSGEEVANVQD